jgi:intracellular septation protein
MLSYMKKRELLGNAIAEFAPIVTFAVASELVGFMQALLWLIVVAFLSFIFEWFLARRIPKFGLVASGTILLFGAISLYTQDEFFIIIKDTLYAFSFGFALLMGIIFSRSYLKVLFGDFFAMSERGWRVLTIRWTVFFFLLALSNELARRLFTPEIWVYYKLGAVFITWVFGFYQFTLARRERLPEANPWGLRIRA